MTLRMNFANMPEVLRALNKLEKEYHRCIAKKNTWACKAEEIAKAIQALKSKKPEHKKTRKRPKL